jgi:hypothetical protein
MHAQAGRPADTLRAQLATVVRPPPHCCADWVKISFDDCAARRQLAQNNQIAFDE